MQGTRAYKDPINNHKDAGTSDGRCIALFQLGKGGGVWGGANYVNIFGGQNEDDVIKPALTKAELMKYATAVTMAPFESNYDGERIVLEKE